MRHRTGPSGRSERPTSRISNWLLEGLRNSSFGLAIYDKRLRFVAVNDAFAAMDHVPPEDHIGRETFEIVGVVSRTIEQRVEHVFRTGEPLNRFELSARLPTRRDIGYWIADFIPITDDGGLVREVGVIAMEITEQKRADAVIRQLHTAVRSGTKINDERTLLALAEKAAPYGTLSPPKSPRGMIFLPQAAEAPSSILSPRELQVLSLLGRGKSNKEVASDLKISEKTVETHRSRIALKLGLSSVADLTRYAIRHGILDA